MDYDFIARNPDYKALVAYVDTGGSQLANFRDTGGGQDRSFRQRGQDRRYFLKSFDWERYKESASAKGRSLSRRALIEARGTP
jgi:NTE family protein